MLNKVILIGRLTKDPEIKVTNSGIPVGTFTLAVSRNFTTASGEREADFLICVCYRKLAEVVGRYVKKGSQISVEGRIQTRSYDGQDGVKRYVTEIICENVVFLDTKPSTNDYQGNQNNQYQQQYSSFGQQQPSFNVNQQPQAQNRYNNPSNNQAFQNNYNNNNNSQPKDDYFSDNPNIDISEDDLPF